MTLIKHIHERRPAHFTPDPVSMRKTFGEKRVPPLGTVHCKVVENKELVHSFGFAESNNRLSSAVIEASSFQGCNRGAVDALTMLV